MSIVIPVQETGSNITLTIDAGSASFLGLHDTPSSFSGSEGYFLAVSGNGSGIEFRELGLNNLSGLLDVDISSPISGDSLVYNGGSWENISFLGGKISIPSGVNSYEASGLDLQYVPKFYNTTLMAPSGEGLIFSAQRADTEGSDGFVVDFGASIPTTGYKLGWEAVR